MNYVNQPITASGGTFNAAIGSGLFVNFRTTSSGGVTLAANVVFSSTTVSGVPSSYTILWDAVLFLSTFSVTIEGVVINQSLVNQTGRFDCYYDGSSWDIQYNTNALGQPQNNVGVTAIAVPSIGGTVNVKPGTDKETYYLYGAPTTLGGNYTVGVDTTGLLDGAKQTFIVGAGTTIGSFIFSVAGQQLSAFDALNGNVRIETVYSTGTGSLLVTYVGKDISPTKLSVSGLGSGDDGKLLQYDHANLRYSPMFLRAANFPATISPVYFASGRIPASEILNLNSVAKTLIAAPGAGKAIDVLKWDNRIAFGSVAYTTNFDLALRNAGAGYDLLVDSEILKSTVSRILRVDKHVVITSSTTNSQLIENTAVQAYVKTGNPLAGDSDVFYYIWYSIITL